MKKLILLLTFVLSLTTIKSMAQCTPDADFTTYGFSPEILSPAYSDAVYNQVLSFLVPRDTSVMLGASTFPVVIDSMRLDSLDGQPAGFTYQCLNRCVVPGGQKGCALLTGKADSTQVGTYSINTVTVVYYKLNGSGNQFNRTDKVKAYTFRIYKTTGLAKLVAGDVNPTIKVFPNPANNLLNVDLSYLPAGSHGEITIIDALGRIVHQQNYQYNLTNALALENYKQGIYKVMVTAGSNTYYSNFVKQ
ncbi:MAG: T9SS C-terminal target domain-containing protein [Bacteroidetes bacterium]|nr:MAG: T9SS C-terminal target domain-containing protein [Bacteroidota bacterium]